MKDYVFTNPFAPRPIDVGPDECIKLTARSLLILLHLRHIDASHAIRQRILDERDIARLEEWHERADTARSLAEVFGEPSLQSSQDPAAVCTDRATYYADVLYSSINEAARRTLEAKGDDFRRLSAKQQIPQEHEEGIKQGREEGIKQGLACSLLIVLRVQGIDVPEATRQRILDERGIAQLEQWVERAATARSLAEVFTEPN